MREDRDCTRKLSDRHEMIPREVPSDYSFQRKHLSSVPSPSAISPTNRSPCSIECSQFRSAASIYRAVHVCRLIAPFAIIISQSIPSAEESRFPRRFEIQKRERSPISPRADSDTFLRHFAAQRKSSTKSRLRGGEGLPPIISIEISHAGHIFQRCGARIRGFIVSSASGKRKKRGKKEKPGATPGASPTKFSGINFRDRDEREDI